MPMFASEAVLATFYAVGDRAHETKHALAPLFATAAQYFHTAQEHCIAETKTIQPLAPWVTIVYAVYPGNTEAYDSWAPLLPKLLAPALASLDDPLHLCTASVEFVWRVWELALDLGADVDDVKAKTVDRDGVLNSLLARASRLGPSGHWMLLLGECALMRYCMPRSGHGFYATSSEHAVGILGAMGALIESEGEDLAGTSIETARSESLSFYLFDRVLDGFVKPLHPPNVERVAQIMSDQAEARVRMREMCRSEAGTLLASGASDRRLQQLIDSSLKRMTDEAQAIANVDSATFRAYLAKLSEDPTLWASVSGMMGMAVGLPDMIAASLAITSLSIVGAAGVGARREKRERLNGSPWSLVYYARK